MRRRLITGALMAAFSALLVVVYKFPPREYSFYPRCPFYAVTHLLCPGCGSTRALHELLHLNLRAALHYNALFTLVLPWAAFWGIFCCYRIMRYDRLPRLVLPRGAVVAVVTVLVVFAVVRNTFLVF